MFDTTLFHTMIPDVFFEAARSWGMTPNTLTLVPLSLACVVLTVGVFTAASVMRNEGRGTRLAPFLWGALLLTLIAALTRWFFVAYALEEKLLWSLALLVEAGGFVAIWVLLLMRYGARSFTMIGAALLSLFCGGAGSYILFGSIGDFFVFNPRVFMAEALIVFVAGLSSVLVRYRLPKSVTPQSQEDGALVLTKMPPSGDKPHSAEEHQVRPQTLQASSPPPTTQ